MNGIRAWLENAVQRSSRREEAQIPPGIGTFAIDQSLLTGVLPKSLAGVKVGRAVPSAPRQGVQFCAFRAPLRIRGALGTARPTHDRVGQHALTSAATFSKRALRFWQQAPATR